MPLFQAELLCVMHRKEKNPFRLCVIGLLHCLPPSPTPKSVAGNQVLTRGGKS